VPPALRGVTNFRDLGGLPVVGGGRTRRGRFFRSESVGAMTDEDVEVVVGTLGIGAVLDLRSSGETIDEGRGPLGRKSVIYANVPMNPAALHLFRDESFLPGDLTASVYNAFLDEAAGMLPNVVRMLATLLDVPTVVHCAAGKDRTGLVIALTLDLVGVDRTCVVEDYMASAESVDAVNEMLARSARYRAHMEKVDREFYEVHERAILGFFSHLDAAYGGSAGWATARGLSDDVVRRLRAALVEVDG
jgi:protein-tyrosine phosphatase